MPRVRYTGGAPYALRGGPTWADGDVHEVGPNTADRLADRHDFELVEETEADGDGDGETFEVSDAHPVAADLESREDLREEMIATVESGTVPDVADAVADGQYDGHLDLLAEVEERFGGDRKGVADAIADRRAELE